MGGKHILCIICIVIYILITISGHCECDMFVSISH